MKPWRFDDARNAALALQPDWADYCISLDLDERLQPGWRAGLEAAWTMGITRPLYRYVWDWRPDGSPGIVFLRDHAHTRYGYRWRHPVHEVLEPVPGFSEIPFTVPGMEVHHYGDPAKDRSSYLGLLELAVKEDPTDDRNRHYLAREYLFRGAWDKAEDNFRIHLHLDKAVWRPERAASMRYLAQVIMLRRADYAGGPEEAEGWLLRGAAEAPERRESWLALALHYLTTGRPVLAAQVALRGTEITERSLDYITDPQCWDGTLEALAGQRVEFVDELDDQEPVSSEGG